MKKLRLDPEAAREFREAIEWYEEKREGLGDEFWTEAQKKLDMIQEHPEIGMRLDPISARGVVRCVRLARFPYSVVYRLMEDELVVLAMAHQSRRPGYWREG